MKGFWGELLVPSSWVPGNSQEKSRLHSVGPRDKEDPAGLSMTAWGNRISHCLLLQLQHQDTLHQWGKTQFVQEPAGYIGLSEKSWYFCNEKTENIRHDFSRQPNRKGDTHPLPHRSMQWLWPKMKWSRHPLFLPRIMQLSLSFPLNPVRTQRQHESLFLLYWCFMSRRLSVERPSQSGVFSL